MKRISQPERGRARRNDVAVFSLVASSAVLLAVAFATTSVAAGCGGVAAVVAPFLVDHRHHSDRRIGRPIEYNRTRTICALVDDERAEQYVTGRFG